MAVTAGTPLASRGSHILVKAYLQAQAVDVGGQRRHAVREVVWIGDQGACRGAAGGHPTIVKVHVLVAGRFHAVACHGAGDLLDDRLGDAAAIVIPAVPAHGWRAAQAVVDGQSMGDSNQRQEDDADEQPQGRPIPEKRIQR